LVAGFCALERYAFGAGAAYAPSATSREFLEAHRQPGRALIVMAVHPRCSCTDASVAELADLLARSHGQLDALLLEYCPGDPKLHWQVDETPRNLGGVTVPWLADRDGLIGRGLGAATSGHVVFVDAHGQIRFYGGITLARDHRGRAPGQDAILAVLQGETPRLTSAPVYGCSFGTECRLPDKS
jgi:hypothetical protein